METGLTQFSGSEFMWLYAGLALLALILAIWLPSWLRPDGQRTALSDPAELALLAGGRERLAEMTVVALLDSGALALQPDRRIAVVAPGAGRDAAQRAVLAWPQPLTWRRASSALKAEAKALRERLVARGLLMDGGGLLWFRLLAAVPLLGVLGLGWYRRSAGEALGEPTGFLTVMMALVALAALLRFLIHDRRTRAGLDALDQARERSSRIRRAPGHGEVGTAVALFGTAVLVGTPMAELHAMRQAAAGDGGGSTSSSSSSSSSDGGGDGGGGCGGCGG